MWIVFGPTSPFKSLFTSRMFAKVPLAITSSFPRRLP
uniref:Aconitate hydratase n=1 Tax=Rhizophora mucronata TaxID=61149 RepID=A0A2P2IPG1_RHIMU